MGRGIEECREIGGIRLAGMGLVREIERVGRGFEVKSDTSV